MAEPGTRLWFIESALVKADSKRGQGDDWQCPAHEDDNASLGVSYGDGRTGIALHCSAGCKPDDVLAALELTWPILLAWEKGEAPEAAPSGASGGSGGSKSTDIDVLIAEHGGLKERHAYEYRTPEGNLARTVYRWDFNDGTKEIRQKINSQQAALYRQSGLARALDLGLPIYVMEGEKAADRFNAYVKSLGLPRKAFATCSPGGSGGWTPEHAELLAGAPKVVIVADNDPAGLAYAESVRFSLLLIDPRIVRSATSGKGDDIVEHLEAGFKIKDLIPIDVTVQDPVPSVPNDGSDGSDGGGDTPTPRKVGKVPWPSPNQPHDVALRFLSDTQHRGRSTLLFWRGAPYVWEEGRWIEQESNLFYGQISAHLHKQVYVAGSKSGDGGDAAELKAWNPATRTVKPVIEEMKGMAGIAEPFDSLPGSRFSDGSRRDLLPMRSTVIDLTAGSGYREVEPTPDLFLTHKLPFDFDPAATCPRWLEFLAETWPSDAESIGLLQEWFGYVLTHDRSQQAMLCLYGATGTGKSTIAAVLEGLLGAGGVASMGLADFGEKFGSHEMLTAKLALVPDARWDGKGGEAVLTRILGISGGDMVKVEKKYQDPFSTRIGAAIMVVANEPPAFRDASQALLRRMYLLQTSRVPAPSAVDRGLLGVLLGERPGIVNWALSGLVRLRARGSFVRPESTLAELRDIGHAMSPVKAFVEERCDLAVPTSYRAELWVSGSDFRSAFSQWREDELGETFDWSAQRVAKELKAAYRHIGVEFRNDGRGHTTRGFAGIRLRPRGARVGGR